MLRNYGIMDMRSEILAIEAKVKASGMTVNELCKAADIDRATWQRWKAGEVPPLLSNWRRVLGVAENREVAQ